jgi:adenine phosphoribosyltransferase
MNLNNYIRDIEDFPIKWIIFKDITPLLQNAEAFNFSINLLAEKIKDVDVIVGLDARWFLFAWALAYKLNKPMSMVRKSWKLPYKTISIDYDLEYWKNTLELHIDAIKSGQTVAIIDDLLATWWTAKASCELIEKLGWKVQSINFIVELWFLWGRSLLKDYTINTLCSY